MAEERFERLAAICAGLPEAESETTGRHAALRVRGKTFVWHLDDHHGDGVVAINAKAAPGENERLIALDPERYFMPSYLGRRGWVGLRLDGREVDWEEVEARVVESYLLIAPKRLADRLGEQPP